MLLMKAFSKERMIMVMSPFNYHLCNEICPAIVARLFK